MLIDPNFPVILAEVLTAAYVITRQSAMRLIIFQEPWQGFDETKSKETNEIGPRCEKLSLFTGLRCVASCLEPATAALSKIFVFKGVER